MSHYWNIFCSQAERDLFWAMLDGHPRQADCDRVLDTFVAIANPDCGAFHYCEADRDMVGLILNWFHKVCGEDHRLFESCRDRILEFWEQN